jgi:hypothetical protein
MKGVCERSVSQASADFFTEAADRLEELERENAELKAQLAGFKEGFASLRELHMKPGECEVTMNVDPAVLQRVAQCFAEMVASSPNYTEMKFEMRDPKPDAFEWITVLVQKGNGQTPHQLRQKAESELAAEREKGKA